MSKETKFKETEIGAIPEDWEVEILDKFLKLITYGFTCPMPTTEDGPFMITAKDLEGNKINYNTARKTSREAFNNKLTDKSRPIKNDILLSKDGTLGRVAIVNKEDLCISQSVALLRPSDKVLPKFLYYLLITPQYQKQIESDSDGSVLKHIYITRVNRMTVAIPKIDEQKRITKILSGLDSKIELNRQMNKTLESLAQALFKHWFVDFEFPNDAGRPYKSSGGKIVYSEELQREVPEGWGVGDIGGEVQVVGGSTPRTNEPKYWENGTFYWATPKDLSTLTSPVLIETERKITELGINQISSGLLPIGTVLLSSRAPIGYLAISEIPVAINQGFIAMVCNRKLTNYYILYWTKENMETIIGRANGTTFLEVSKSNFRPISIVVPSDHILSAFTNKISAIHRKIICNLIESRDIIKIRDSLLPKLMSGEIRVSCNETR